MSKEDAAADRKAAGGRVVFEDQVVAEASRAKDIT